MTRKSTEFDLSSEATTKESLFVKVNAKSFVSSKRVTPRFGACWMLASRETEPRRHEDAIGGWKVELRSLRSRLSAE